MGPDRRDALRDPKRMFFDSLKGLLKAIKEHVRERRMLEAKKPVDYAEQVTETMYLITCEVLSSLRYAIP